MLGDLHDGNGLSDASYPDCAYSNPIFDAVDYDVLTIGTSLDRLILSQLLTTIQATTSCIFLVFLRDILQLQPVLGK
jgi:hypothetical protein